MASPLAMTRADPATSAAVPDAAAALADRLWHERRARRAAPGRVRVASGLAFALAASALVALLFAPPDWTTVVEAGLAVVLLSAPATVAALVTLVLAVRARGLGGADLWLFFLHGAWLLVGAPASLVGGVVRLMGHDF